MTLFPNKLNDEYKGSKLAIYGLYPVFALYIFRSFVHFLSENAGLVGIATIKELPIIDTIDPNNLVYFINNNFIMTDWHNNPSSIIRESIVFKYAFNRPKKYSFH